MNSNLNGCCQFCVTYAKIILNKYVYYHDLSMIRLNIWKHYTDLFLINNISIMYWCKVDPPYLRDMTILGAETAEDQTLPILLYQDTSNISTCVQRGHVKPGTSVCEDILTIPIENVSRSRYVYLSTKSCLKVYNVEVFAGT